MSVGNMRAAVQMFEAGTEEVYISGARSRCRDGNVDGDSSKTTIDDRTCLTAADRDTLVEQHSSTVRYVARQIRERLPQHVELEDLVSCAIVGVIAAASKFGLTKKVQFNSYAQFAYAELSWTRSVSWIGVPATSVGRGL